uniref:SFRICE_023814 n=1 Tax=Spodoptera frugiperda TaxID=7108 RepID=A0A2H1WV29_SPOFR
MELVSKPPVWGDNVTHNHNEVVSHYEVTAVSFKFTITYQWSPNLLSRSPAYPVTWRAACGGVWAVTSMMQAPAAATYLQ